MFFQMYWECIVLPLLKCLFPDTDRKDNRYMSPYVSLHLSYEKEKLVPMQ